MLLFCVVHEEEKKKKRKWARRKLVFEGARGSPDLLTHTTTAIGPDDAVRTVIFFETCSILWRVLIVFRPYHVTPPSDCGRTPRRDRNISSSLSFKLSYSIVAWNQVCGIGFLSLLKLN
jgi:hypothetical protein